jgi:DoxX-like family
MTNNAGMFERARGLLAGPRVRTIAYWVTTAIMAWEMFVGGGWADVAMVVPRAPRLKEWAYAGAFCTYRGAVASHLAVGGGPDQWAGPAGFGLICLASWALRSASRRDLTPRGQAAGLDQVGNSREFLTSAPGCAPAVPGEGFH